MKIIDERIPEKLRSVLRSAGDRKIVFVEGKTDEKIYYWLFKSQSSIIHFEKCGSKISAEEYFNTAREYLEEKYVHAILDKDFDEDNLVKECLIDMHKPFRLNWFSIENFLLNGNGIIEGGNIFLDLGKFDKKNSGQIEHYIINLCERLLRFSAAHKVSMKYGEKMPGIGHDNFEAYIKSLSIKTNVLEQKLHDEIDQQLQEWKNKYNFSKSTDYYHVICGKRIVHFLHKEHQLKHPKEFKNFLVNYIVKNNSTPAYLLDIIKRILDA